MDLAAGLGGWTPQWWLLSWCKVQCMKTTPSAQSEDSMPLACPSVV